MFPYGTTTGEKKKNNNFLLRTVLLKDAHFSEVFRRKHQGSAKAQNSL